MEKDLSLFGETEKQLKKVAKKYSSTLGSDIGYKMIKLLDEEIKEKYKLEFKMELVTSIRNICDQYKCLFEDYARAAKIEYDFQAVSGNQDSAYTKAMEISKHIFSTL